MITPEDSMNCFSVSAANCVTNVLLLLNSPIYRRCLLALLFVRPSVRTHSSHVAWLFHDKLYIIIITHSRYFLRPLLRQTFNTTSFFHHSRLHLLVYPP